MIPVLYSDDHIIVVDKPHDLLSVPGKGPDKQDCLWHRIQYQSFPTARIVHRLDFATSGLMILALTSESHALMSKQFQDRNVFKRYEAVVFGTPDTDNGIIDQPMRCDWERRPLQIVDHEKGKQAITKWEVIGSEHTNCRLWLYPKTGRSHQLRVHMQWLGHTILGDRFYAEGEALDSSDRLLLHAQLIKFRHPITEQELEFCSPAPF